MLRNLRLCVDNITTLLMHVEIHIPCDFEGGEQIDSLGSNPRILATMPFSKYE